MRASSSATDPREKSAFHSFSPDWRGGTIIRFSRTVIDENSCAIWKVRKSPFSKSLCGGRPVMSSPSMKTWPLVAS
jgi:hypothetical protein